MKGTPSIVAIGALLGDPARASMLNALMDGVALTASELASVAGITPQTASSHLSRLVDAGLLCMAAQGRHRYFRIAAADVATMLETIMGVAERTRATRKPPGPRDPALRRARRCYDHLAGELAVQAYDSFVERDFIEVARPRAHDVVALTAAGRSFFSGLGIDVAVLEHTRRPVCRPCLDWSVRRYHLAGSLGQGLLEFCYSKRWARSEADSRVVRFSARGEREFAHAVLN